MPLLSFSHEIESKLYPDYDDSLYQRMYIELKKKVGCFYISDQDGDPGR
jgi:hypothetical protein